MEINYKLFYGGIYSNWYPAKFKDIENKTFANSEQYFMVKKAEHFGDYEMRDAMLEVADPSVVKKMGRKVKDFDPEEWNKVSKTYMYLANYFKFTQNPRLLDSILKEDGYMVEASPYDKIWGIGLDCEDPRALDPTQWQGTNWLGDVLNELRNDLRLINEA